MSRSEPNGEKPPLTTGKPLVRRKRKARDSDPMTKSAAVVEFFTRPKASYIAADLARFAGYRGTDGARAYRGMIVEMIHAGILRPLKDSSGHLRFHRDDVERLLLDPTRFQSPVKTLADLLKAARDVTISAEALRMICGYVATHSDELFGELRMVDALKQIAAQRHPGETPAVPTTSVAVPIPAEWFEQFD